MSIFKYIQADTWDYKLVLFNHNNKNKLSNEHFFIGHQELIIKIKMIVNSIKLR